MNSTSLNGILFYRHHRSIGAILICEPRVFVYIDVEETPLFMVFHDRKEVKVFKGALDFHGQ
jgi:hypothetical protein